MIEINDLHDLIHRDDVDVDDLADIEAALPNVPLRFAGDIPGGPPPGVLARLAEMHERMTASVRNGTCFICGAQMEGYPAIDASRPLPTTAIEAKGWCVFESGPNKVMAWCCPRCDAESGLASGGSLLIIDKI